MNQTYRNILWIAGIVLAFCAAVNLVRPLQVKYPLRKGLDISGGTRAVLVLKQETGGPEITNELQQQVVNVMQKRVNAFGVSEPVIQAKGADQVVVEMPLKPGVTREQAEQALQDLIRPAKLEFIWLKDVKRSGEDAAGNAAAPYEYRGDAIIEVDTGRTLTEDETTKQILYFDGNADKIPDNIIVTGADLKPNGAKVNIGEASRPVVALEFNDKGTKAFADFTSSHTGDLLAIVLNGKINSAPKIQVPITDGKAVISGGFADYKEAQQLADLLNAGALPVPVDLVNTSSVEATLGSGSVKEATRAGIIGIVIVVLFMLLYYALPGAVAAVALLVYTAVTFTVFRLFGTWFGLTLTLPGIAGYILSIGMAVDANILIFERMKEELKAGKALHAAVDSGFARAWTSIRDSNISTLITCAVLYSFGTGPIKGFALVLAIGVIISLFTAISVSRALLHVVVNAEGWSDPKYYRTGFGWGVGGRKPDIMGKWPVWFTLSAILIGIGWAFIGMHYAKSPTRQLMPYGIDFTGGAYITYAMPEGKTLTDDEIKSVFSSRNLGDVSIQRQVGGSNITVRTKPIEGSKQIELKKQLEEDIRAKVGAAPDFKLEQEFANVGPSFSRQLTVDAVSSVLIACVLITLYLAVMFSQYGFSDGLKYGLCAVIALFHDVLVIFGFMGLAGYLMGWELNSLFVTAALTVIGFSVHDTIVVYDRIRENLKLFGKEKPFKEIANDSIVQTMGRSINTTLTVVITLAALLLFGTSGNLDLRVFTSVLLVGIISGTYSSIFNASPLLMLFEMKQDKKRMVVQPIRKPVVTAPKAVTPSTAPKPGQAPAEKNGEETEKPKPGSKKTQRRRF